jgi:hypothetical protein
MRPFRSLAFGALVLTWLVGSALADDSPSAKMSGTTTETVNSQPAVIPQECGPKCAENCGPCCGNDAECGHFVGAAGFVLLKPHLQNIAIRSHLEFRDAAGDFHAVNTITELHDDLEIGPQMFPLLRMDLVLRRPARKRS